jgi:sarcosine oxidase
VKIGRYHHAHESLPSEAALNDVEQRERIRNEDRGYTDGFMQAMFTPGSVLASSSHPVLQSQTCIFTNTPDEHFLLDVHPDREHLPQVAVLSACSGHGFKFSTVLGEVVARGLIEGIDAVEREMKVTWLDAGRLLGDRPPLQTLNPSLLMQEKQL